jgi:putative FmdB family regulatory protein
MVYEYRCENESCHVVQELIQSIHDPLPDTLLCPKCGGEATQVLLTAPGLLTGNMGQKSLDVMIGKDAETRWGRILDRKAQRDKIREKTGSSVLRVVGRNEHGDNFCEPLKDAHLEAVAAPKPKED